MTTICGPLTSELLGTGFFGIFINFQFLFVQQCFDGSVAAIVRVLKLSYAVKCAVEKNHGGPGDFFHYYNTRGTVFPHIQCFNNMVFRNGGRQ